MTFLRQNSIHLRFQLLRLSFSRSKISRSKLIPVGYGTVSGNYVKILGPNWRIQYYAHMKKSDVWLLQFVRKGEKIGEVGNTGNAMGKPHHLHFSVTTIFPHFWKLDGSIQGWKQSLYLNPE